MVGNKEKITSWSQLYAAGTRVNRDNPLDGFRTVINAIREQWYAKIPYEARAEHDHEIGQADIEVKASCAGTIIPSGYAEHVRKLCPELDLEELATQWNDSSFHDRARFHIPPALGKTREKAQSDSSVRKDYLADKKKTPHVDFLRQLHAEQGITLSDETMDDILWNQDISILPLNLVLPIGVKYFLPTEWKQHTEDSFGVKRRDHVVTTTENNEQYYLATRKEDYTTFLVIFGRGKSVMCLTGCNDCYRGTETRELNPFQIIEPKGRRSIARFFEPEKQMHELVQIANSDPRYRTVNDILLSGGEPLQESNDKLWRVIDEVIDAHHITSFRICTGDLYLGRAARFDDELVQMLHHFENETSKSVHIAAHIPHEEMLTPEAIYASLKLRRAGIEIQTQTPLIAGINTFLPSIPQGDDALTIPNIERAYTPAVEKSYHTLLALMEKLVTVTGVRPYKWLNDTEGSVPVEFGAVLWEFFRQHRGTSDKARATSYAKFHPEANIDLSLPTLLCAQYSVDGHEVVIRVPQGGETYELRQPLVRGVNYPVEAMRSFYVHLLGSSSLFRDTIRKAGEHK